MRHLLAIALLVLPLSLLAGPIKVVKLDFTNEINAPMHYIALTIAQDTQVLSYPAAILKGRSYTDNVITVTSAAGQPNRTRMLYTFALPADLCHSDRPCTETVTLQWETNALIGEDCAASGENFEPLKYIRAFCTLPEIDPDQPDTLLLHYYFMPK